MTVHPASLSNEALIADCTIQFSRASGPGGQNRNKVETAVILTHNPSGIRAEANERRKQGENREQALFRLRLRLALEVRCPAELEPSPLWASRCKGGKISINPAHLDFPSLLAEALDVLAARHDNLAAAAAVLGCSTTQLVKLLKDEPRAFKALNDRRVAGGLQPLK